VHTSKAINQDNPKKSRGLAQSSLWLLASYQVSQLDMLTIDTEEGDGECLPVFSFEEEAQMFLQLSKDVETAGWWIKKVTPGELVSLLLAHCVKVKRVALDPLPTTSLGRVIVPFFFVGRERFTEELLEVGKREGAVEPLVPT
jgi:hypothetical protein